MATRPPRRSVMYVPAINQRAMAKVSSLDCDSVVFDLEDAVAPGMKAEARRQLVELFAAAPAARQERVIRVNAIDTEAFVLDMAAVAACRPDAVLLPKLRAQEDFDTYADRASREGVPEGVLLWAMVETPAALVTLDALVTAGLRCRHRLDCLVVGTNDIAKDTGVFPGDGRALLLPWLMDIVLVAKHRGVSVLDGVWNDFADAAGFDAEARQAVKMAFDGKTLIHPSQVAPANRAFSPGEEALAQARAIVEAFARPEHADAGVINLDGRMVERLHLMQAERLLAIQQSIDARSAGATSAA
ncbi:MAG: CoA ester lyase [Comamonadaceae bacterium]|nr:MAG: CoA ester lyase [Comamonadaceae bacterium]